MNLISGKSSNMTKQMQDKYPEKFREAKFLNEKILEPLKENCDLRLIQDKENFIAFYEEIYSIVDMTWITEVHLTDLDQIDWLLDELRTPDFSKWDQSKMFNDRKSINERYGW